MRLFCFYSEASDVGKAQICPGYCVVCTNFRSVVCLSMRGLFSKAVSIQYVIRADCFELCVVKDVECRSFHSVYTTGVINFSFRGMPRMWKILIPAIT